MGKDMQNGVIGTAWNIEAFILGYQYSGDKRFLMKLFALLNYFHLIIQKVFGDAVHQKENSRI